jgi:hypothetical protein
MNEAPSNAGPGCGRPRLPLWPCLLIVAAVLSNYAFLGWTFRASDLTEADEPAHYATGVMVFDYVHSALGRNPMAFAQSFYTRFPKVAFGHWPPLFYVVEAAAFLFAGPRQLVAKFVSAAPVFLIAIVVFRRVGKRCGWPEAAVVCALFLAIRTVRLTAWMVMSDSLTSLFMLLAVLAFSDFLELPGRRNAMRFSLWSVLAILAKGSAWGLGIFAVLAPWLAGQPRRLLSRWYWISGAAVFALGAPFYWMTRTAGVGYSGDVAKIVSNAHPTSIALFSCLPFFTPVLAAVSVAGFATLMYLRWGRGLETAETRDGLCAAAAILGQALFLWVFPATWERRYFLPSGAMAALLSAPGVALAARWIARRSPTVAALAAAAVVAAVLAEGWRPVPITFTGYRASVRAVPFRENGSVILVSADAVGEGDWIVDRLEEDRFRADVVLRASSVLASSDWTGDHYRLRVQNADGVVDYLHATGVKYLVVQRGPDEEAHQTLVEDAVRKLPGEFQMTGVFPLRRGRKPRTVYIYTNNAVDRNPPEIRLPGHPNWPPYRMKP